ncbi:MAG: hypothetical protein WD335_00320 [Candidatus Paceibacterota bacterium]
MDTAKLKSAVKTGLGWWAKTEGYRGHLFVALVFDLLSMIPWVGMIFSFLGYAILWLWFEMGGINPSLFSGRKKAKKAASFISEWLFGLIGLGIFPGIMMWTYFAVSEHKEEQVEKQEATMKQVQEKLVKQSQESNRRIQEVNTHKRRAKTSAYQ